MDGDSELPDIITRVKNQLESKNVNVSREKDITNNLQYTPEKVRISYPSLANSEEFIEVNPNAHDSPWIERD